MVWKETSVSYSGQALLVGADSLYDLGKLYLIISTFYT